MKELPVMYDTKPLAELTQCPEFGTTGLYPLYNYYAYLRPFLCIIL